jgi:hypothetical protein
MEMAEDERFPKRFDIKATLTSLSLVTSGYRGKKSPPLLVAHAPTWMQIFGFGFSLKFVAPAPLTRVRSGFSYSSTAPATPLVSHDIDKHTITP